MDGLSEAIGVDDRHFIPTYQVGDIITGGGVTVDLPDKIGLENEKAARELNLKRRLDDT